MPDYFVSDTHLCLDQPQRGERLARLANQLRASDRLTVGGDLCDFWFASREMNRNAMQCAGLRALAEFRERGGQLTIIVGNHDASLGGFYEHRLGARVVAEPLDLVCYGQRVRLVHGHLLGSKSWWKSVLEWRVFLTAFSRLPSPIARRFQNLLEHSNQGNLEANHRIRRKLFRQYAQERIDRFDLFVFGHVHQPVDESLGSARLIILGDWVKTGSYLAIDESGVSFVVT